MDHGFQPHGSASAFPASQTYHSADGTQAYTVDEYGRGTYWQLPPAPRLPVAAPRGWFNSAGGFPDSTSSYIPWMMAPQRVPINAQHHHEIESQLMLQHQLSKLHNCGSYRPDIGSHMYPAHPQTHQHLPAQYAPVNDHASSGQHHATASQTSWNRQRPADSHTSQLSADVPPLETAGLGSDASLQQTWDQSQYFHSEHPLPHLDPSLHPVQREQYELAAAPALSASQWGNTVKEGTVHSGHFLAAVPDRADLQNDLHRHSNFEAENRSAAWHHHPHPQSYDLHRQLGECPVGLADSGWQRAQDTAVVCESSQHQQQQILPDPTQDPRPAPPSPGTLDKSAVPISNFGAEIIWYVSSAFLEPELLLQALSESDDIGYVSPSGKSLLGSPLSGTPAQSPQRSAPSTSLYEAPAYQLSHLGIQSFESGNSSPLHHLSPQRSRLASFPMAEGERLRSPLQYGRHSVSSGRFRFEPASDSSLESSGPNTPSPERDVRKGHCKSVKMPSQQEHRSPSLYQTGHKVRSTLPHRNNSLQTRAQERSRRQVHSALQLVSPKWLWSTAQHPLPTLLEVSMMSLQAGQQNEFHLPTRETANTRTSPSHVYSPREGFGSPQSSSEISPAFRRFAHQVLAQTLLSPTAFLLALLYALRIPMLAIDARGAVDPEAIETFASPPSAAPFKLFTLGLMLANKHLDDNTFLNKTWHEVTGIPLAELNKMERYYLIRSNFEIAVPMRVWHSFLRRVKGREEANSVPFDMSKLQYNTGLSQSPRKASESNDDTSRRVLLAVDDMLLALEHGDDAAASLKRRTPQHAGFFSREGATTDPHDFDLRSQQRPKHALYLNHHQCQSAPAPANSLRSTIRDQSCPPELYRLPPRDATLDRSLSDYAGLPPAQQAPLSSSTLLQFLNSGTSFARAHG